MASDRKLMLQEYAQSPRFANFCMGNLEQHQALVFMSGFKQELYRFRIQDDLHNFQGYDGGDCLEDTGGDNSEAPLPDTANFQNSNVDHETGNEKAELLHAVSTEQSPYARELPNTDSDFQLDPV
jgi:hypothetical protein